MSCHPQEVRSVAQYFDRLTPFARPLCEALRALIRSTCPTLTESLKWKSPCYSGRGLVCGLGAFKRHVTLHFFRGAELPDPAGVLAHGTGNASSRSAKFTSTKELDPSLLRPLLEAAVRLDREGASPARKPARRAPLPVSDSLTAALRNAPKAAVFFESLPPSHQREYVDWITEAKRPETQVRRLASAVAMLAAGRRHDEGYRR